MAPKKGKQNYFMCYFPPGMLTKLRKLSKKTDIPIAALIRKGVKEILK